MSSRPASSRKTLGNLCGFSGWGRDTDLNMGKRVEADSGLEHFSKDPCAFLSGRRFETSQECRGDWK